MSELCLEKQGTAIIPDTDNEAVPINQSPHDSLEGKAKRFLGNLAIATTGWMIAHGLIGPDSAIASSRPVTEGVSAISSYYKKPRLDDAVLLECGNPAFKAPVAKQLRTMHCLHNYVRQMPLGLSPGLNTSAYKKTSDVIACDFILVNDHYSCGKNPGDYTPPEYPWIGENLAWGYRTKGNAQSIFFAWMHSESHRKNILGSGWDRIGIALQRTDGFSFWTTHFGDYELPNQQTPGQ